MVFHHPDYNRPYYGAWVTQADHTRIHSGLIDCPDCVDYSDCVEKKVKQSLAYGRKKGAQIANKIRWGK